MPLQSDLHPSNLQKMVQACLVRAQYAYLQKARDGNAENDKLIAKLADGVAELAAKASLSAHNPSIIATLIYCNLFFDKSI